MTSSTLRSDLLTAEHDLDGIALGTTPSRSIVVCATPGADCDPVANLLQGCGAGVPLEYFDLDAIAPPLVRRWRVINLDDYVTALHHHRSAGSGVFGVVLTWRQLRRLHGRVAGTKPFTAERTLTIVRTIAPVMARLIGTSPEEAARTPVFLAQDARAVGTGGRFYGPKLKRFTIPPRAQRPDRRSELWEVSEDLVRTYLSGPLDNAAEPEVRRSKCFG